MAADDRGLRAYWRFLVLCFRVAFRPWEQGESVAAYLVPVVFRGVVALFAALGIGAIAFVPPVYSVLIVVFVILVLLWAPYRVWQGAERRVLQLEQERQPKIQIFPEVHREFVGAAEGEARAFLRICNTGTEALKQCCGRMRCLVWAMSYTAERETRVSHLRLFEDRDIYFRWQGVSVRHHSFHKEAILEIAYARYGDGYGGWSAHTETPAPRPISYFEDYYLSVEIAADNIPSQTKRFRLKLYTESQRNGKHIILEPSGTPPHMDFESIS